MSLNLIDPEILSAKYCTHWAEFCCTPTQINEIPKPLVRSVKRDSTWSRVQNTHGQTFLSEKAGWFSGKCPSPALTHVQSIYRTTCMPWLQVVLTLFSHTSLFLITSLFSYYLNIMNYWEVLQVSLEQIKMTPPKNSTTVKSFLCS